jgi:hypothetical protein
LEKGDTEGDIPVYGLVVRTYDLLSESRVVWDCSPKPGGKFLLKLNICERPIANKYREGKLKRTLKRESNSA